MKDTNYTKLIDAIVDFLNRLEDIVIPIEGSSKELFNYTPKKYKSALLSILMIDNKFKQDLLPEVIKNYIFSMNLPKYYTSYFNAILNNSYLTIVKISNLNSKFIAYDMFLNKEYCLENKDLNLENGKYYFVRMSYINKNINTENSSTNINYYLERIENFIINIIESLDADFAIYISKSFNNNILMAKNFINPDRELDRIYFSNISSLNIFADIIDVNSQLNLKRIVKLMNEMEYFINNIFNGKDQEIFISYLGEKNTPSKLFYVFTNLYSKLFAPRGINISLTNLYNFEDLISSENTMELANSNEEFKDIVFTFRDFIQFASKIDSKFNKTLNEVNSVINNIFMYIYKQKNSLDNFYFDNTLLALIASDYENEFLIDFESFIHFIDSLDIIFSKTDKKLTHASIKFLEKNIKLFSIKNVKNKKQHHYPLLDVYYNFCVSKRLLTFEVDGYDLTNKSAEFLELPKNKQLSIFIEFLIFEVCNNKSSILKYDELLDMINILYEYEFLNCEDSNDFLAYFSIFEKLGIISIRGKQLFLTSFGKRIFKYFLSKKNNVIAITDYMGV